MTVYRGSGQSDEDYLEELGEEYEGAKSEYKSRKRKKTLLIFAFISIIPLSFCIAIFSQLKLTILLVPTIVATVSAAIYCVGYFMWLLEGPLSPEKLRQGMNKAKRQYDKELQRQADKIVKDFENKAGGK